MAIQYTWREPFSVFAGVKGSDPQTIGDAIQKIKSDHGGELRPRYVWTAAKAPRHPLHRYYEWNVEKAAEKYWDHVSRKLIGAIRIVGDDDRPDNGPAFISIRDADEGVSYRTLDEVLDSAELQAIALRQAERDLAAFTRRYEMFAEVCALIRQAQALLAKRREKRRKKRDDNDRPRPSV